MTTKISVNEEPFVYDKAKYHYGADDFPSSFPISQAYVHTGVFVGWLADMNFLHESSPDVSNAIAQFKRRELTGPQLYERLGDCLIDYMVTARGNSFARDYFELSTGRFIEDYRELLVKDLGSEYAVKDTWQNYDLIKSRIDERYAAWTLSHPIDKT
ncbi:hypothetical protein G5B88_04410 [Herbaspirillum seropedicae]|uniref:DUF7832 domain-containing protein n=1 Tax=Herbaspirillum seropedicae (strain SmR1) TaxID=757424 RepID=D8J055_HERSS|nr:hypothetical protein [Herbaspirillum seropedicae]ADJ62392.1 conserved hypothetical protein [Herbaspirillum seropedicae SmR1]AKN64524.1 hypothetical protein ACP92_04380 [Herbaspirillum seropedicae]UMU20460.1 hypothetical protein G5B88_04410 [Herbaspirillum seropedicae]